MSEACDSTYKVAAGTVLHCSQDLGSSRNWKHSARYLGVRWYWTTAEADQQSGAQAAVKQEGATGEPAGD